MVQLLDGHISAPIIKKKYNNNDNNINNNINVYDYTSSPSLLLCRACFNMHRCACVWWGEGVLGKDTEGF